MKIKILVTGRNYHAADQLPDEVELPEEAGLDDALKRLSGMLGSEGLPDTCLIAVSGNHVGTVGSHEPQPLRDGDELVLIAPVAGG